MFQAKILSEDEDDTIIDCQMVERTDKAVQVIGVENKLVWLPLSQCEILSANYSGSNVLLEMIVPNWLVDKNPLV